MINIKPAKLGTLFALLTILYSFALGATFGLYEEEVKDHIKAEANAVKNTVYKDKDGNFDQDKYDRTIAKAWTYCKRSHMHAGGLGAIALAIAIFLGVLRTPGVLKFTATLFIGVGSLGYSVFWALAAHMAPGLGSTGDAKKALELLAQPAAGLCLVGLLLAFIAFFASMCCNFTCQDHEA